MRRTLTMYAAALLLAACGGGGGGDSGEQACTSSTFFFNTTWTVTGGTLLAGGTQIVGRVGVPFSAKPVHAGIPAGCVGRGTYSIGPLFPAQSGLTLNATTGEISGTPVAAGGGSNAGTSIGSVVLSFPGFGSSVVLQTLRIDP
jgi:hypothetical protein